MHKVAGGSSSILKTVTGALLHITDALAKPAKKFVATLSPIQDLHGQDAPYPSGGGKNLLPMTVDNLKLVNTSGTWSGNIYTLNSATFTLNTDNGGNVESITVGGTSSARSVFLLWSDYEYVADLGLDGRYYISGCPSGGSGSTYSLTLQAYGSGNISDTGSGVAFNTSDLSNQKYRMIIDVRTGSPTSTLVFKPLFCLDSVSDKSFSPYSNICPITGHTGANVVRTGVNVLPFPYPNDSKTLNGVTFTVNGDGSITATGTPTGTASFTILNSSTPNVPNLDGETVTISGCPSGGSTSTFYISGYRLASSGESSVSDTGTGKTFVWSTGTYTNYNIAINIKVGTVIPSNGLTFYPQITLSSTASTYEPYTAQTIPITFPALGKNLFDDTHYETISIGSATRYGHIFDEGTYYFTATESNISWFRIYKNDITETSSVAVPTTVGTRTIESGYHLAVFTSSISDLSKVCVSTESITSYEPYTSTAYGGTLTNEGGEWKLRVTDASVTENSSTGWTGDAGGQRAYKSFTGIKPITVASNKIDAISNYLVAITTQEGTQQKKQGMFFGATNSTNVSIHINDVTDKSTRAEIETALGTYLSSNPLQVVYKLATPIEYTLTETQALTLLKGENNIWVDDSDNLVLDYLAKAEETTP